MATVPAGYILSKGLWYAPDGTGPFFYNSYGTAVAVGGGNAVISAITRDGQNRLTGYTYNGAAHTVAYPDSTHITDTGDGHVATYLLDGLGNFLSKTVV